MEEPLLVLAEAKEATLNLAPLLFLRVVDLEGLVLGPLQVVRVVQVAVVAVTEQVALQLVVQAEQQLLAKVAMVVAAGK
jgi:hypothetical protein